MKMTRIVSLVLGFVMAAPAALAGPAFLRDAVTVSSDVVRIGDLVGGAGAFAGIAVFRSPDLGHVGSIGVNEVAEAVRRHGLTDIDHRGLGTITVARASHVHTATEIEAVIADALAIRRGHADATAIALTFDRAVHALHAEPGAGALRIEQLHLDPRSGRFDVTLGVERGLPSRPSALRHTGTMTETVAVTVLARQLQRGDVIRAGDIIVERRPRATTPAGVLDAVEQVAGLAARRPLRTGQLLRPMDLMKPELVRQNEIVTVVYETEGISLSVRGQALAAGAAGETVNVLNIHSKRTMQGIVVGPGRIAVPAAPMPLVTAAGAAAPQPLSE